MKRLETLIGDESKVFEQSKSYLGETYDLVGRIDEFYQFFITQICSTNLGFVDLQFYAVLNCIQASSYEYLASIAVLLRGQIIDSANHSRRALEFCAFGIEVLRSYEATMIWLNSGTGSNASKRYKDYFKIMKMIGKATDFYPKIKEQYNIFSEYMVHASFSSVYSKASLTEDRKFQYKFLDVGDSEESYGRMAFHLLNTLDLHMHVIKAFQCAISHRDTEFDHGEFYKLYSPLFNSVIETKIAWIPIFEKSGIDIDLGKTGK